MASQGTNRGIGLIKYATISAPPLHRQDGRIDIDRPYPRSQTVYLDMTKHQTKSPHELASDGNLGQLQVKIDKFPPTLKARDANNSTLLHSATRTNQMAIMLYLIESQISLDAVDRDGNTALHIAVENGHIEAMHLLLNNGASDKVLNKKLDAPLHIAVRGNNANLIAAFLEHPVNLCITGYRKRTPLHVIAEHDNLEACEIFHNSSPLQNACHGNFRICFQDEDELTPIHLAARKGSHRVLDYMITKSKEHGYPTEAVLAFLDEENSTPLHAAVNGNNLEVVEVLLKHGACPVTIRKDEPPPLHLACAQSKLEMVQIMVEHCEHTIVHHTDHFGRSSLHYSAHAINSAQLISFLVRHKADVDLCDHHGRTALHTAIIAGSLAAAKELLSNNANPLTKDQEGCNSLHYAVMHNRKAIVNILLKLPCAPQLVSGLNSKGQSPVHCALKLSLSELVSPMVSIGGPQIHGIVDANGDSYLHLAAFSGDWRGLSVLLDTPAYHKLINEANSCGATPLHMAAFKGHIRCVQILLSQGAMSHKCGMGLTPFLLASFQGHSACAKVLHAAHPYQRDWTDDDGNTALHLAAKSGRPSAVTLALDLGIPVTHNLNQESVFDLIIKNGDTKSATAVINHKRWQECLDLHSPLRHHPMLQLVVQMPEVAKAVLDKCHTRSILNSEHRDYWEEFNFKYLQLLPETDTKRDRNDNDTDSNTSEHTFFNNLISSTQHKGSTSSDLSLQKKEPTTLPVAAVRKMTRYNRVTLITHPVVEAYLKVKWRSYGWWVFMVSCILHVLMVAFLSAFIVIAPRPGYAANTTMQSNDGSAANTTLQSNDTRPGSAANTTLQSNSTSGVETYPLSTSTNAIRAVLLALCAFNTICYIGMIIPMRSKIFLVLKDTWTLIAGVALISTFVFLIPNEPIWEAGALACFIAWFQLVMELKPLGTFGIYVMMFLAITRTVLRVLVIAFLLIAAFAFSLYILAGTVPEFSTIGFSFFSTFGYMLGEVQYELFIHEKKHGNLQYSVLTFMTVVALAILLSIVMANLLIGLAVGDIEKIRMNAIAERVGAEVDMYSHFDSFLPRQIIKRFDKPVYRTHPNCSTAFLRKAFLTTLNADIESSDHDSTMVATQSSVQELSLVKQQLKELTEIVKELRENQSSCEQEKVYT